MVASISVSSAGVAGRA